jgi:hypothetical protein
MRIVGLYDYRRARGKRGDGVAAGDREGEGEVTCAEHSHRPDGHEHSSKAGVGSHRGRDRLINDCFKV